MARATWNGAVIAESDNVVVVDGYTYFPREAVRADVLEPSAHTSVCAWKGQASYYSLIVNGERNADAAWEYHEPKPAAEAVRGRIGFWRGVKVEP